MRKSWVGWGGQSAVAGDGGGRGGEWSRRQQLLPKELIWSLDVNVPSNAKCHLRTI